jgi:type II secretory pathway pseudopilin PulG
MHRANKRFDSLFTSASGFTLVEVIVAAGIMIVLCVGVLTVFAHVTKLNRGNNIRSQALTVLQKEVEHYRALKFVPVNPDPALNGHGPTVTKTNIPSADGTRFDIEVTIDNDPYTAGVQTSADVAEVNCKFKEITIKATLTNFANEPEWVRNLRTAVTFQRVRLIN